MNVLGIARQGRWSSSLPDVEAVSGQVLLLHPPLVGLGSYSGAPLLEVQAMDSLCTSHLDVFQMPPSLVCLDGYNGAPLLFEFRLDGGEAPGGQCSKSYQVGRL